MTKLIRRSAICFIIAVPICGQLAFARGTAASGSLDGRTVTVIRDRAKLISDGKVVDRPNLGENFRIDRDEGNKLWVNSRNAYLKRSDVILYQDAIDFFTHRIDERPSANDFDARGRCWEQRGAIDQALSDYNEAIRLDPTKAHVYVNRGNVWNAKREFEKALDDFSEAIRLRPNYAAAFNNRGTTWGRLRQFDKAIADFNEAIRFDPNDASAYQNSGLAWLKKKDFVNAMADIENALRINPNSTFAYDTRARLWIKKGEYDRAIADSDHAILLKPNSDEFYATRAEAHAAKGDVEKALADFNEAIRIDPPAGYNGLAWMRATHPDAKFRNGKEAIDAAIRACELTDWKNDSYIDTLSAALAENGQFDESIQRLQQAIDMNPESAKEARKKMMAAFKTRKAYREDEKN